MEAQRLGLDLAFMRDHSFDGYSLTMCCSSVQGCVRGPEVSFHSRSAFPSLRYLIITENVSARYP